MKNGNTSTQIAFALCLMSLPLCPSASRAFGGGPTANNDAWMQATRRAGRQATRRAGRQATRRAGRQATRQAGRQADVQQVTRLTKALQNGSYFASDPDAVATMLALSQIGSADALPVITAFLEQEQKKTTPNSDAVNAALVARARIIAEQTEEAMPAGAVIRRFYAALQQTPEQINADVTEYVKARSKPVSDLRVDPLLGVYALRTVADMAYQSRSKDFVQSPEVTALNFGADPRSALKMSLASLSDPERAAWLVETLSHSKVVADKEDYEIQLAGDLGPIVEPLAAAKVQEMSADREKYPPVAFDALFGVLSLSGEQGQAVVKQYQKDRDPAIAEEARRFGAGDFIVGY